MGGHMSEDQYQEDETEDNAYSPFIQNVPKSVADLEEPSMPKFYRDIIDPTNKHALPYYKEGIDEDGKEIVKLNLVQMFTKELKTANLDKKDYDYIINTFNFAIMMIDNGIIGQTSLTLLHMIETRLMASNSKSGFLLKQMLSTIIKQNQTVEDVTKKGLGRSRR